MSRRGGYGGLGYIVIARPTWSAVRGVAGADRSRTILPNSWPNWCRHAVACSVPLRTAYGRPRQAGARRTRAAVYRTGSRKSRYARRWPHQASTQARRRQHWPPRKVRTSASSVVRHGGSTFAVSVQPHSTRSVLFRRRSRFASPPLSPPLHGTAVVGGVSTKLKAVTRHN